MRKYKLALLSAVCTVSLAASSMIMAATAAQCRTALKLKPSQSITITVCPSNASKSQVRIMSDFGVQTRIVNTSDCTPTVGPC